MSDTCTMGIDWKEFWLRTFNEAKAIYSLCSSSWVKNAQRFIQPKARAQANQATVSEEQPSQTVSSTNHDSAIDITWDDNTTLSQSSSLDSDESSSYLADLFCISDLDSDVCSGP